MLPQNYHNNTNRSERAAALKAEPGRVKTMIKVFSKLEEYAKPMTAAELFKEYWPYWFINGIDTVEIRRRLCDLKEKGAIIKSEERKCRIKNKLAIVWEVL